MSPRIAASILITATLTACVGPPQRISAGHFCDLYSRKPESLFNSEWIGRSPGPSGRAYLEVWMPRLFGPDLVVYFTPVQEFDDDRLDGCPFELLYPEVPVVPM